jgi:flagellar basal-body rod protein FlgB
LDNHQKRTQSGGGGPKELGSPFWDRFVIQDRSTSYRNDGNNVDIDLEMTRLAENTLHYNSLITMLTGHLNLYKQVIRD